MTVHGRISDAYLDLVYSALPMLGAEGTTPAELHRAINFGAKTTVRNVIAELMRQGRCVRVEHRAAPGMRGYGATNYRYFRAPQEQPCLSG